MQTEFQNNWLDGQCIAPLSEPVAVGWSGGADSTALLLALRSAGHRVQAWHVDHAWRTSSKDETELLAIRAEQWGIPFYSARLERPTGKNIEAEARAGRYACFERWGQKLGVKTLCLGHHQDDQAETVYMRMLQGAGAAGCRGMHRERMLGDLRLLRPLLHVPGGLLRQILRKSGIEWLDDPSNSDSQLWRNRIRHRDFAAMHLAGVDPGALFLRWKSQADRLTDRLDMAATALLKKDMLFEQGVVSFPWKAWYASEPAVRARALQKMMADMLGAGITPGRRHIELVEAWTIKDGRGGLDLSRCRLYRRQGRLHLQPSVTGNISQ
ncbi:tRNA(Ile)-lysidine synthase [Mariprofundus micogutta]|uniref:tRNA(Ile)-lysidine synthase n=1 Tax=Mariprofundus micogutta TaxID=1921010 RepID=A0A1L8CM06_9PROT|nr:tRNA lysidine(34) synthetase TilS [Mariprofundus micogutta]GAV19947.1 tRNA(Ile)-lysidine synthase [Mariprofundus micogutta]